MNASMSAQRARLSDGRWHFQHGPIDIVIGAQGEPVAVKQAHQAAWLRFGTVLEELVGELPVLRQAIPAMPSRSLDCGDTAPPPFPQPLRGTIAQRMWHACAPYSAGFITPMAAVAGAVAQELIACYARPGIERAWVNNGGDIALHLTPGQSARVGLFADLADLDAALGDVLGDALGDACGGVPGLQGLQGVRCREGLATHAQCEIGFEMPVRGIATSGWRGRSFSLGIADSVTVLAKTAAMADAAATVIANAVNVAHPGIVRRPACEIRDDSDLGVMLVTLDVPRLPHDHIRRALVAGRREAESLQQRGLIDSAVLVCQGQWMQVGRQSGVLADSFMQVASLARSGPVFA